MRTTKAGIAMVGLGLILAGCGNGNGAGGDPTPGNATATPTGTGAVASCVVGQWRSTAVNARIGGNAASAQLNGGEGISVNIEQSGATRIDFGGMEPVTFTARVGGADVRGRFVYGGRASGQVTTGSGETTASPTATGTPGATDTASPTAGATGTASPIATGTAAATASPTGDATATPTGDQSGTWQPVGDINWDETRLTLDLTEPVQARPFDNVPIGQYVGSGAERSGNAVDIDPFFDNGRYTCQGDRLLLTPDDDGDIPWTLVRA
ncbi:MAG TPA: hypothetical protein VNV66_06340 [Pilimelia sp.]|nr:hypothetical protein [Pilimelia sp.]